MTNYTVKWRHQYRDLGSCPSNRIGRCPRDRNPFHVFRRSQDPGWMGFGNWRPSDTVNGSDGYPTRDYRPPGGPNYRFGYWLIRETKEVWAGRQLISTERTSRISGESDPGIVHSDIDRGDARTSIVVEAIAYYVWDLGDGPGRHAVYLDAVDMTDGDDGYWFPDDFVAVVPDDAAGSLTTPANDGLLFTDTFEGSVTIQAGDVTSPIVGILDFDKWTLVSSLTSGSPPFAEGRNLSVQHGDITVAVAGYKRRGAPPELVPDYPGLLFSIVPIFTDTGIMWVPRAGNPPGGPPEPQGSLFAALHLLQAASFVGGEAKQKLLQGAHDLTQSSLGRIENMLGRILPKG